MGKRADEALIGRTIAGKFTVESFLGGGAMGAVYRARQFALDKTVAVKVMNRDLATDELFVTRFHREAKAASRLDHPNSIRVIDFGEEPDGLLYIAMEFLDGKDLFRVLHDEWPLPPRRVADLLMQVLAALAVAHDLGVVHRDLKPENIMVLHGQDDEGRAIDVVKVCDFGIAKMSEAGSEPSAAIVTHATTRGLVIGTPEYMSPEQGKGESLDARSDLYSVGVILYQLLTGRLPFRAESAIGTVLKHVTEEPTPPSVHYPHVDTKLEAICLRALAKKREDRYQGAREMRAELRAAVDAGGLASRSSADNAALFAEAASPDDTAIMVHPPVDFDGIPAPAAPLPTFSKMTPVGTESPIAPRPRSALVPVMIGALLVGASGTFVVKRQIEAHRVAAPTVAVAAAAPVGTSFVPSGPERAPSPVPSSAPLAVVAPSDPPFVVVAPSSTPSALIVPPIVDVAAGAAPVASASPPAVAHAHDAPAASAAPHAAVSVDAGGNVAPGGDAATAGAHAGASNAAPTNASTRVRADAAAPTGAAPTAENAADAGSTAASHAD